VLHGYAKQINKKILLQEQALLGVYNKHAKKDENYFLHENKNILKNLFKEEESSSSFLCIIILK